MVLLCFTESVCFMTQKQVSQIILYTNPVIMEEVLGRGAHTTNISIVTEIKNSKFSKIFSLTQGTLPQSV